MTHNDGHKCNNNTYHLLEALLCARPSVRSFQSLTNKPSHQGKCFYFNFTDEEIGSECLNSLYLVTQKVNDRAQEHLTPNSFLHNAVVTRTHFSLPVSPLLPPPPSSLDIITTTWQMRKLRCRQVRCLLQGHILSV